MITKTTLALLAYLCVAGFVADAQSCNSTTNTTCMGNQMCTGMTSYCNIGYCACPAAGMKLNGTMCITPMVSINGSCMIDANCMGVLTSCINGKCVCSSPAYTAKSDGSDCMVPMVSINGFCMSDANCMGEYTSCINGKCVCSSASYTAKSDGSDCMVPPLHSNCTASCGSYASCTSGVCQCWSGQSLGGYMPVGGSNNMDCRAMKPNDPCSNVTDCPPNSGSSACANANCNNGTYQCNSGYQWVTYSNTISLYAGCVPSSASMNVAMGQPCSDSHMGGNTYMLCASGLTCSNCGGSWTCQSMMSTTTPGSITTTHGNGACNVRLDMMALVSMLALALLRFAA